MSERSNLNLNLNLTRLIAFLQYKKMSQGFGNNFISYSRIILNFKDLLATSTEAPNNQKVKRKSSNIKHLWLSNFLSS